MRTIHDIPFPALSFQRGGTSIAFLFSSEAMVHTNATTLRLGQFSDAFVIDVHGVRYRVVKARIVRIEKPYIDILLFDPNYLVAVELGEPEQLSIEAIRDLTVTALRHEKIRRKSLYQGIQRAHSVPEMVQVLYEAFYGKHGLEIPGLGEPE